MSRNKRFVVPFAALALTLAVTPLSWAGGGSGAHYKTTGNGKIEFNPDGSVKSMMGDASCTGVKVQVGSTANSQSAVQVPASAKVASFAVFEDPGFSRPLMAGGVPVTYTPDADVAALAAETVGPAKPGFVWVGYRSNELLANVAGNLATVGYWVYTFDTYPARDDIGRHEAVVFISDSAERVQPAVDVIAVYEDFALSGLKLPRKP